MKYGWKSYDDPATYQLRLEHPLCTTENHLGRGITADFVVALVDGTPEEWVIAGHPPDTDHLIYGACRECVEGMGEAAETTVEHGLLA